ncbi:MAG TPA: nucleotidyltransferase domain-containing protein [Chitinophagaceae bacterium]
MEKIKAILKKIEQEKKVKILYACETGSRAWGFPSPDSDYDVRFIYMHERDWYLSLSQRKDTIEYIDGEMDITGWDLKKSLILLKKSNAPLIERFQSPITYYTEEAFENKFKGLIEQYYSPTAVFYHHYSLAQKFWEGLKGNDEVKLKSYFYLMRSLLSCNWIIKDKTVLPMDIEGLMSLIDGKRANEIRKLIKLKAEVGEKYFHKADQSLNAWITELFELLETNKNDLGVNRADNTRLDMFFLKMVNTNADN